MRKVVARLSEMESQLTERASSIEEASPADAKAFVGAWSSFMDTLKDRGLKTPADIADHLAEEVSPAVLKNATKALNKMLDEML